MTKLWKTSCLAVTIIATLALSGCARLPIGVSPKSRLLEPGKLDAGSAISSAAKQSAQWPSQGWWKAYGDPQLDRLVAEATSGNPSMHIAQSRIAVSQALSGVAKSALFPQIQADASLTRQLFSEHGFVRPPLAGNWEWLNNATFGLVYDLDLWGKNRSAYAAALDNVQITMAEAQEVRLALETAVVRVYVQLSLQHVLLDIARQTLRQRLDILNILQKRHRAGLATEIDAKQAETVVPAARAEIERISESIELLRNQLSALAGKGPGYGEQIRRPVLSLDLPIGLPSAIPADLLGRRPDVVARRWGVEAAGKGIKVAKAAFYPNINLIAFIGLAGPGFQQIFICRITDRRIRSSDFLADLRRGTAAQPASCYNRPI